MGLMGLLRVPMECSGLGRLRGVVQVLNESGPNLPEHLKPVGHRAEAAAWAETITCRTQGKL